MATLAIIHVLGSLIVGWAGRNRKFGFFGFFILSLIISPLIALLFLVIASPSAKYHEAMRRDER